MLKFCENIDGLLRASCRMSRGHCDLPVLGLSGQIRALRNLTAYCPEQTSTSEVTGRRSTQLLGGPVD